MDGQVQTPAMAASPPLRTCVHGGTYVRENGDGDPVVLIHGVGLDHTMWEALLPELGSRVRIIRYDMLGHGQSAHPPGERRLGDFVSQLHQLFMNLGIEKAAVVGFSMGGMVARAFAQTYPEHVSRLVLMSTVFERSKSAAAAVLQRHQQAVDGHWEDMASAVLERWFTPAFRNLHPEVLAAVRDRLMSNDRDGYLGAYKVFASTGEQPTDNIRCPALIMTGADDTGSTPEMAAALRAAIPGSELVVLNGLRHLAPMEDPTRVGALLKSFLGGGEED